MATAAGHSIASMTARVEMRMPLLDVAFQLMDNVRSPQDFSLILHFRDAPNLDGLYAGARSAMNRFPTSASCVNRQSWVWRENKYFKFEIVSTGSDCESRSAIEKFVDEPFDLHHQPPVRQSVILNGPTGAALVTRFHHSAADGLSAALWLGHQLNVAYGLEAMETEPAPFVDLPLRRLPTSVRRSDFAFDGASDRLWTSNSSERSGARRWMTIAFPAAELQRACRRVGGFTYNDLLATCTLEVFSRWNATHLDNSHKPRIGLWMPMNIRREANVGFGNGTSRIRLYARYKDDARLVEKCCDVRRQVSWTSKHGEWVVPEMSWFTRVPRAITRPLLRSYLNLSPVDMCTGVFSHAGSWIANAGEAFKHVDRIECVGLLHERQSVTINAATHHAQTWLSLTYDPRVLSAEEAQQLGQMYEQQIDLARDELL
jgi:hypothetical protein